MAPIHVLIYSQIPELMLLTESSGVTQLQGNPYFVWRVFRYNLKTNHADLKCLCKYDFPTIFLGGSHHYKRGSPETAFVTRRISGIPHNLEYIWTTNMLTK